MSESYYRRALLSATILCLILENWRNSAVHGTSLSSVVLIARVRTLALCRTRRCHTIAYKYHGSLLWIIQLPTNITGTCRWVVNIFLTDAVAKYHLRCEIQKIWTEKVGAKVIQQNPQKDWLGYKHKWGSLWTQWRIFGFYSTLFLPKFSHIEIFLEFNYITRRFLTVVSRQTF